MRAKPSSTAIQMYSSIEEIQVPNRAITATVSSRPETGLHPPYRLPLPRPGACLGPEPNAIAGLAPLPVGDGLLHDARNLIGTLGLYCDLLSRPGVLQPQHRQYADDLRLVGTRSAALIERLVDCVVRCETACPKLEQPAPAPCTIPRAAEASVRPGPIALRYIVERCTGLLRRVAGRAAVEVSFGEAASAPVAIDEEAVERILVNLVRNAAAAVVQAPVRTPGPIRIGVGLLVNRVGDPKPWPFRRVRLTIEDFGCGMTAEQLQRLTTIGRAPSRGSHGIGFRVVQQLVAASNGDLRVMSQPGVGTCVQIEWPMADVSCSARPEEGWASC